MVGLTITKVTVDPKMSNNAYILHCEDTGECVLIDAAYDAPTLLATIGDRPLTTVITTHQHWDHHRALAEVVAATGASVIAGEPDAAAVTEQTGVAIDRTVVHGDQIAVGTCELTVLAIAGHTPGSIALFYSDPSGQGHLFTGDSLFPGGPGRTTTPEDFASLMRDLQEKVFDTLPDETLFYPGHGDHSTLGAERPHIPEWLARGW